MWATFLFQIPRGYASSPSPEQPGASEQAPASFIGEVNTQSSFMGMLKLSDQDPVILDCYTTWCEPCKTLTPLLEAAVKKTRGAIHLAKMNVEIPGKPSDSPERNCAFLAIFLGPPVLCKFQAGFYSNGREGGWVGNEEGGG